MEMINMNSDYELSRCPICGQRLNLQSDYDYNMHMVVEEWRTCPEWHYEVGHAYGAYRNVVMDLEFYWDYTTPDEDVQRLEKEFNKAVLDYQLRI